MSSNEWRDRFEDLVSETADLWASVANRSAMGGDFRPLRMFYRPASDREWGALFIVRPDEIPDSAWSCAGGISPAWNRAKVRAWIHETAYRLPLIGSEDPGKVQGRRVRA